MRKLVGDDLGDEQRNAEQGDPKLDPEILTRRFQGVNFYK
jgi:hypothetical protein